MIPREPTRLSNSAMRAPGRKFKIASAFSSCITNHVGPTLTNFGTCFRLIEARDQRVGGAEGRVASERQFRVRRKNADTIIDARLRRDERRLGKIRPVRDPLHRLYPEPEHRAPRRRDGYCWAAIAGATVAILFAIAL